MGLGSTFFPALFDQGLYESVVEIVAENQEVLP
jgi:hypothetical protein